MKMHMIYLQTGTELSTLWRHIPDVLEMCIVGTVFSGRVYSLNPHK